MLAITIQKLHNDSIDVDASEIDHESDLWDMNK